MYRSKNVEDFNTFLKSAPKKLFYLIVACLPLNLGLHFVSDFSFVKGFLVDYLIPTFYIQDILILVLLIFWFINLYVFKKFKQKTKNIAVLHLATFFVFFVGLSFIYSINQAVSFFYFIHLLLYFGFFCYVVLEFKKEDLVVLVKIFSGLIIFLSVLGILQFLKQGSLFNNYLFFGEQPYTAYTTGIAKEPIFSTTFIPSYGLFRHPNTFAGFLGVLLFYVLCLCFFKNKKFYYFDFKLSKYKFKFKIGQYQLWGFSLLALGLLGMLVTFSFINLFICLFLLLYVFLVKKKRDFLVFTTFSVFMFLVIGFLVVGLNHPSFLRRANLNIVGLTMFKDSGFLGFGPNTNTLVIENYYFDNRSVRFIQPVHNMFILLLSESGFMAFLMFVSLLVWALKILFKKRKAFYTKKDLRIINKTPFYLFLSLVYIMVTGVFDHFWFTMPQTSLLFWLTLGIAFTYND